jgi:hypothetical protein
MVGQRLVHVCTAFFAWLHSKSSLGVYSYQLHYRHTGKLACCDTCLRSRLLAAAPHEGGARASEKIPPSYRAGALGLLIVAGPLQLQLFVIALVYLAVCCRRSICWGCCCGCCCGRCAATVASTVAPMLVSVAATITAETAARAASSGAVDAAEIAKLLLLFLPMLLLLQLLEQLMFQKLFRNFSRILQIFEKSFCF